MLIAARNAMMAGKRLPYDAEVEYLESTGTQWIDTGVTLARVRNWLGACEVTRLQNTNTEQPIFSTWVSSYNEFNTFISGPVHDNAGELDQYAVGQHLRIEGFVRNQKKMIRSGVDLDGIYGFGPNVRFITLDTQTKTYALTDVKSNPTTLKLFTRGDLNGRSSLRMYSFSLLIGTEYAIDFAPVRFTNEQGVSEGAMYDRLGVGGMNPDGSARTDGLYFNRGTGDFIIGPDK